MNIYIWDYVNNLTENYHDGGGLNIIASSLERARELWTEKFPNLNCECLTTNPEYSLGLADNTIEENIIVFPDPGCC